MNCTILYFIGPCRNFFSEGHVNSCSIIFCCTTCRAFCFSTDFSTSSTWSSQSDTAKPTKDLAYLRHTWSRLAITNGFLLKTFLKLRCGDKCICSVSHDRKCVIDLVCQNSMKLLEENYISISETNSEFKSFMGRRMHLLVVVLEKEKRCGTSWIHKWIPLWSFEWKGQLGRATYRPLGKIFHVCRPEDATW